MLIRALRVIERLACYNGLSGRYNWRKLNGNITCLLYHRIAEHGSHPWLESGGVPVTPPTTFRAQLEMLKRQGGVFFTLEDLGQGALPPPHLPGFVITFDDGFQDNFSTGRAILEDCGIRGVFFVITSLVERRTLLWEHLLYRLVAEKRDQSLLRQAVVRHMPAGPDTPLHDWLSPTTCSLSQLFSIVRSLLDRQSCDQMLAELSRSFSTELGADGLYPTWDDLRAAQKAGHQIGSHTTEHRQRHLWSAEEFSRELTASKLNLEEHLQCSIAAFSYPFNSYLFGDHERCRNAGYAQVATVEGGRFKAGADPLWIPRLNIHGGHDSMSSFRQRLLEIG